MFEVYNIAVKEPIKGYYADVKIFKQIPESEAAMSVSAYGMASTRTADGCNRTALYAYDGSGWNKHALNGITLDVMQPEAYHPHWVWGYFDIGFNCTSWST